VAWKNPEQVEAGNSMCNNDGAMTAENTTRIILVTLLLGSFVAAQTRTPQTQAPATAEAKAADALELVKQGQKLVSDGQFDKAMAVYQRALQTDPDLYEAQLYTGVALDLEGKFDEARQHLGQAISLASDQQTIQALRVMAVSYAFQCNTDKAAEYERRAFDLQYKWSKLTDAAGTADELARIYLECGDYDNAFQWYQTGHLTGLKQPNLTPTEKDVWEFRWEAALARIAARKGQGDKAQQHLAAAKAMVDKLNNPDQARFFPYLAGYVAFYAGDYKTALADLQKANEQFESKDPFVLSLLAQTYEKSGDKAQAIEYYKKVLTINLHSPTNAFARPLAEKKLGELKS
jgi:tetratricopeptide (TPR) repeat protein